MKAHHEAEVWLHIFLITVLWQVDRLCGLVVRVLGYRSRGPGFFAALPDFLRSSGFGTGATQLREYN
jgi:hypothetical protein